MKKKYTAAVIGTGRIGFTLGFDKKREQPASHTSALKNNPRIKIIAGCDVNEESLSEWKKYCGDVKIFTSVKELLQNVKPDIITVSVNEDAHLKVALEAINAKPLLVILEKPVALNMNEAKKIALASKKTGVPVLVNHERRFALDYNTARKYLSKIGDIQTIHATLSSGMRLYDPEKESSGAYSLLHDGTHLVDIVLFMLEALSQETKKTKLLKAPVLTGLYYEDKKKKVLRNLSAHYSTPVCPDVTLNMSGRSRYFGFELDIRGTVGQIYIGNGFAHFYLRQESKLYSGFYSLAEDKSVKLPKKTGYFSNMIQNAVDFLDGKCELKSTLETGMNALGVLEEIVNALKK